ncbi:MAG: phosphate butyryltransferase [Prevotella sp.]|nr:phosphate butyryltransferase [Prevotella sp.]
MEIIRNFEDLVAHLAQKGERKRVAVVWASDGHTQFAVHKALEEGFISAIFVGCRKEVEANDAFKPYAEHISFVDSDDRDDAAAKAVALVREQKADILMKGLINTDNLLHAVLNKETGILPKGRVLTHLTCTSIPGHAKLIFFTDAAVIPYPTQEQRIEQVRYVAQVCHSFGIEEPKISLIHCTEKPNEKFFPFTIGYADIIEKAKGGEFGRCIVDGPLDVRTSCDIESMKTKGIESPIAGEADALIFPDIEAGNVFYKAVTLFSGAETAAFLQGTLAPVVLTSRGDSEMTKFYSLALAAVSC